MAEKVTYTCGCSYEGDLTSASCPYHPSHVIVQPSPVRASAPFGDSRLRLAEIEARLKGYSFVSGANHGLADDLRYVLDLLAAEARGRQQAEQERPDWQTQRRTLQETILAQDETIEELESRVQQAEQARDEALKQLAEKRELLSLAAMEINCAGPVHERIRVLRRELSEKLEAADSRLAALTQALKDYGQHANHCIQPKDTSKLCTCGLDAALTGAPRVELRPATPEE